MIFKRKPTPPPTPLTRRQGVWLLAAALAGFLPLVPWLPPWMAPIAGVAFAWRGFLLWRGWGLPPRWLLVLLTFGGTVAVGFQFRTIFGKDPGIALLGLFLALKLLEMRSPRDALTVIFLGYFLALSQFFYAQGIVNAVFMAVTLIVTVGAQINLNHAGEPALKPLPTLRLAGVMLVQSLPFMLVLFVLFPRIPGPLWGLPLDAHSGMTGLSDSMAPGSISKLSQSDAIAFRVRFKEATPPPQSQLYWRGPVMSEFDGRLWRAGAPRVVEGLPYETASATSSIEQEVTLEAHNKPWLFALELPVSLPADAFMSRDYQLLAKGLVRSRLRYEVRSSPKLAPGVAETESTLNRALALPDNINPRSRELAARLRQEANGNPHRITAALEAFFARALLIYTLNPPLLGQNSVDEFLFDSKRGFCEHFAASYVFLARAAGVPARVVTGYQGGEINPVDGVLVVRQYDAHAWAEVWLPGQGWQRVDPTAASAPSRIEGNLAAAVPAGDPLPLLAQPAFAWLKEIRYRLDAVGFAWNQWVLGYNPQKQKEFLESLGMKAPDWKSMTSALALFCGLLLLGFTAWALHQRRRLAPAQAAWEKLSRKLARHQLARLPWEGPRDYLTRLAAALPQRRDELSVIEGLYESLRYSPNPPPELLATLRRRIREFRP